MQFVFKYSVPDLSDRERLRVTIAYGYGTSLYHPSDGTPRSQPSHGTARNQPSHGTARNHPSDGTPRNQPDERNIATFHKHTNIVKIE